MNDLRKVDDAHHGAVSVAGLVMFSDVRLVEDYQTEGYLLPKGKIGALVERFSDNYSGVDYSDLQDVLIVPTRLLTTAYEAALNEGVRRGSEDPWLSSSVWG